MLIVIQYTYCECGYGLYPHKAFTANTLDEAKSLIEQNAEENSLWQIREHGATSPVLEVRQ